MESMGVVVRRYIDYPYILLLNLLFFAASLLFVHFYNNYYIQIFMGSTSTNSTGQVVHAISNKLTSLSEFHTYRTAKSNYT